MMDTQHLRGKRGNTNVKHEARDAGVGKQRCSLSKQTTTGNEPRFCSSHPGLVLRSLLMHCTFPKTCQVRNRNKKRVLRTVFKETLLAKKTF